MVGEKIIIFGMGGIFQRRIKQFDFSKVIAVTDNRILHKGDEYSGFKIIQPEEIITLEYDLIVICTGYKLAKQIYVQLTETMCIQNTKIISEKKYFKKLSWEPRTFLEICDKLGIHSIINSKKYFHSYGILSNTNVMGEQFTNITWEGNGKGNAILLGEVQDEASLEYLFENFEAGLFNYESVFKYAIVIVNTYGYEDFKVTSRVGYCAHYYSGVDLQLVVFQKQEEISIYVAAHKDYDPPTADIYTTLWLGEKKNNNIFYLKEDGENIDYLNLKINECTGLYWMWKYAKEQILGLNHYRRFFRLNNSEEILSEEEVRTLLEEYDIIVGNSICTYPMTNSEYLKNSMEVKAFNRAKQIVQNAVMKNQPEYMDCFTEVMEGYAFFPCNMFITIRNVLDKYCEWLFSIVIPAAEKFDEVPYENYSKRAIGFFAERLLTVWLYKQNYRIKEIPILLRDTT